MSLVDGFLCSANRHPDRLALRVGDAELSYGQLHERAARIAAAIRNSDPDPPLRLAAIFAYRSWVAYAGILGCLMAGKGYVPLNPRFPAERSALMREASGVRVAVVDRRSEQEAATMLVRCAPMTVLLPEHEALPSWAQEQPQHRFVAAPDFPEAVAAGPSATPTDIAYLLFTSGTTGRPKGVAVTHANVESYLSSIARFYNPNPEHRFSQFFDLTFDLSVHDMFVCWGAGASLLVVPEGAVMAPGRFIREQRVTHWFSVPSTIAFMKKLGLLKPNSYPDLQLSLFCGEALPAASVTAWQAAAPNGRVENLYGPTEATIAFTRYAWRAGESEAESHNGIVPIGEPFPGQQAAVFDERNQQVTDGEPGELCLAGDQVVPGYFHDDTLSRERFVIMDDGNRWYRTGDLAKRGKGAGYLYLGRLDSQIKIMGFRVELQEIENLIRARCGVDLVVALGWPLTDAGAGGIIVYLGDRSATQEEVIAAAQRALPDYMVPREVHFIETLPLNANGKVDRKRLLELRREMEKAPASA